MSDWSVYWAVNVSPYTTWLLAGFQGRYLKACSLKIELRFAENHCTSKQEWAVTLKCQQPEEKEQTNRRDEQEQHADSCG